MSSFKIGISLPPGLPAPRVTASFEPETAEQFDAIIDTCGGATAFQTVSNFAYADFDGYSVNVKAPAEVAPPRLVTDPAQEFIRAFGKRSDEARRFKSQLDEASKAAA